MKRFIYLMGYGVMVLLPLTSNGYTVHYIQQTVAGGKTNVLSDVKTETGPGYVTQTAPLIDGYGFVDWSISVRQVFESRDIWGRAHDFCSFDLYETSVLTANYIPNNLDTDEDGIGDCWEMYWYGDIDETGLSDTDGDGYTFVQELHAGTNPHFVDTHIEGVSSSGLVKIGGSSSAYVIPESEEDPTFLGDGPKDDDESSGSGDGNISEEDQEEEPFENPNNYPVCTIRSEPEGLLFKTYKLAVEPGETVVTEKYDFGNSFFGQWEFAGVRQADTDGIALPQFTFVMPATSVVVVARSSIDEKIRALYHYHGNVELEAYDSDGDGYCDKYEQEAGLSTTQVDIHVSGGVFSSLSEVVEMDLQPHEQLKGVVLDSKFQEVFYSPVSGNDNSSWTFGKGLTPYIFDVDKNGLWDIVLRDEAQAVTIWLNKGTKGNPQFVSSESELDDFPWDTNAVAYADACSLDVPTYEGLSATYGDADGDGVIDILVSDMAGRIWYYKNLSSDKIPLEAALFELQHKAWGGSHAGFAEGLMLAAVDWEDDGDLDCICGTAHGKLMLLRNPKVGRPTNVKALAGVDNVLLTWDPNAQSRVRGYRVYRAAAEMTETTEGTETTGAFDRIAEPPLPTYRDFPGSMGSFDYKVSSISRFYTAGNSTPTVTESPMTEAVRATLGTVKFFWNDVVCKLGENANVMLSIENSLNYNVAGTTQTVTYDPEYLRPLKVAPTGLTEAFNLVGRVVPNAPEEGVAQWEITIEGGDTGYETLPAGGGKFLTLVFETLKEGTTVVGGSLGTTSPTSGATVTITARSSSAPYQLGDVTGDGVVDVKDLRELAKLKNGNGRKPTANQLKAGDFNGNGKLDNADYQALRELLKEKGAL